MVKDKRDWSTGFTRPYYKVFPFVKENVGKLGWVALLKFIVTMVLMFIGYALYMICYILAIILSIVFTFGMLIVLIILISLGSPEWLILVIMILIGIVVSVLVMAVYFIFIAAVGSVSYGVEIYACRKILDIFKGDPVNFDIMKIDLERDWKIYLEKGLRLFLAYIMVVVPIILLPILLVVLAFLLIMLVLMFIDVAAAALFGTIMLQIGYIFIYIIILFLVLLLAPFMSYILDWSALRIADGMSVWEAVKEATTYIWKKPRLMKYYWVGYFLINISMVFFYPLAYIAAFVLPILTKVFLLVNDEEYG